MVRAKHLLGVILVVSAISVTPVYGAIVMGTVSGWQSSIGLGSPSLFAIGDGTVSVNMEFVGASIRGHYSFSSANDGDSSNQMLWGSRSFSSITDVTNALSLGTYGNFTFGYPNGAELNEYVFYAKNSNVGVFRFDAVENLAGVDYISGTWWFQNDGTGDFSTASDTGVIPLPPTALLLVSGLVGMIGVARRKKLA